MERAIRETDRRREKQREYNVAHGITPATIKRDIHNIVADTASRDGVLVDIDAEGANNLVGHNLRGYIEDLEKKMRAAAADLEFEEAGRLRDEILQPSRRASWPRAGRQTGDAEDALWQNAAEVRAVDLSFSAVSRSVFRPTRGVLFWPERMRISFPSPPCGRCL
jgi:Ultra-violet resistance protein B/UvrB/uvrC motif